MSKSKKTTDPDLKSLKVSHYSHLLISKLQEKNKEERVPKRKPTQDEVLLPLLEKEVKRVGMPELLIPRAGK